MPHYTPNEMATAIAKDLLSFPITHMKADLSFDEGPYRSHLNWIVEQKPAAVFADLSDTDAVVGAVLAA